MNYHPKSGESGEKNGGVLMAENIAKSGEAGGEIMIAICKDCIAICARPCMYQSRRVSYKQILRLMKSDIY
jgi:hypothetical protein